MSNLYLILHKVRGQPALDIATPCDDMGTPSDPSPWWIIPTSGHRAYPEHYLALNRLTTIDPQLANFYSRLFTESLSTELRDHYEATLPPPKPTKVTARQTPTLTADQLLELL